MILVTKSLKSGTNKKGGDTMSPEVKHKVIQNLFKTVAILSIFAIMFLFKYYMIVLFAILLVNLVIFAFQRPVGYYFPPLRKLYDIYPPENNFSSLLKNCVISILLILLGAQDYFYGSDEKGIVLVILLVLLVIFNIISWIEYFMSN